MSVDGGPELRRCGEAESRSASKYTPWADQAGGTWETTHLPQSESAGWPDRVVGGDARWDDTHAGTGYPSRSGRESR